MAIHMYVVKHHDRQPLCFGWNTVTNHLRFPLGSIEVDPAADGAAAKKHKVDTKLDSLGTADVPESYAFRKDAGDIHFIFPTAQYGQDCHLHVQPVPHCDGVYVNSARTGVLLDVAKASLRFGDWDTPFASKEELAHSVVAKCADRHQLVIEDMKVKHAFLWFHPHRRVQVVVVLADHRVIWSSSIDPLDAGAVSPPNGCFEAGADSTTWKISFHHSGQDSSSSTLFRYVAVTSPAGISMHCAIGGSVGCVITHDVHASNQYSSIKEWAVCALQFV
jgi:hypothetical protein